ncbi:MAG: hypothetical protein ACYTDT_13615 [Planctomycetota bacterium]|jgi:hypothetical protein
MEFKITRGQGKCSISDKQFEDGEQFIIALIPDAEVEGHFQRVEICGEVWERQDPSGYTAWWPSEFSTNKKPALLDPDLLWEIFHRARVPVEVEEGKEPEFTAEELSQFEFVAALGLMRLKKLKMKDTIRKKGVEFMRFQTIGKRAKDRKVYEVKAGLDEAGILAIQDRLTELV